ncbi:MAG: histidine kinase [Gomphosphaeria aponina SAG 52.96 = DSM 107014]|uniref:Adaptive-response sensory-kinase SasA n=1 Tax=Gomphosphaeria aponina SAG 52.96 = DSM 107014 TaxID=1521640 RepID=A0A941GQV5_9CHRO|nr:histidine kinase [Gomphosphaeria aponina SAG 52.96 = DSM 107014]
MLNQSKQAATGGNTFEQVSYELILFVDDSASSQEYIQQIQGYLQSWQLGSLLKLQVIELRAQPHLVEHFRLVATPALVKISPAPRHTLAGSDLIAQLKKWLPRWQALPQQQAENGNENGNSSSTSCTGITSVGYSAELMRLSDEIFRLKQEKEALLEQLQFKDQVLAMLAHDLRSPLTAASLAVETLELAQNQPDPETSKKIKKQLYRQARSQFQIMNRMITDLLQASSSISKKLEVKPEKLSLQNLCAQITTQLTPRLQQKFQHLKQDIPQDLPAVYADEELIRQLLVNLLDNAIKYTPAAGTITLSILHRTAQKIQVNVSDTGPGIPEAKRERIFDGHFRLQRDQSQEGYGLGLSLCRKIVCAHYGEIWVDSVTGGGSSFQFTLPVYR